MSRKLVALVLLLAMVCPMLFACGSDLIADAKDYLDKNKVETNRKPVTVNFFMMTEIENDLKAEAGRQAMQNAFNAIIEPKYNTHVEFTFVKKADYENKLLEKFTSVEAALKDKNNKEMTKEDYEELYPSITSSNKEYPDVAPTQMDIFLSVDSQSFISYIENGDIIDLTSMISSNWRDFSDATKVVTSPDGIAYNPTISDVIFSNAYYLKQVYADTSEAAAQDVEELKLYYGLPSSFLVGSYDYKFVRKAEADKYYLSLPTEVTDKETEKKLNADLKKLDSKLDNAGISVEEKNKVVIYLLDVPYNDVPEINGFKIDEYYRIDLKKPQATYEEICQYMFCVSANTVSATRSYEVLHELYTNAELHTILQYGSPSVHCNIDDKTKTVTIIDGATEFYKMDIRYTGNMFTIYPCSESEVVRSYEDLAIANIQNKDASQPVIPTNKYYTMQLSMYESFKKLYYSFSGDALDENVYKSYTLDPTPYADILNVATGLDASAAEVRIARRKGTDETEEKDDTYGYIMKVKSDSSSPQDTTFEFWVQEINNNGEHKAKISFKYSSPDMSLTNEYNYSLPYTAFLSSFTLSGMLENENQNEQKVNCKATIDVTASSFTSSTVENEGLTLSNESDDLDDTIIRTVYVAEFVKKLNQTLQLYNIFAQSIQAPTASDLGFTSFN